MKHLIYLVILFSHNLVFSQTKIDSVQHNQVVVQLFTRFDIETAHNEASTLLDESVIEKIYINKRESYRVIILVENRQKANQIVETYKQTYKDCFISYR